MVHHGNQGKRAGKRKVRKSGSLCPKLVDWSVCHNLPAESAIKGWNYVIDRTDDVNWGGAETNRPQCFGYRWFYQEMAHCLSIITVWLSIKMIAHQMTVHMPLRLVSTERQQSVNDFSLIMSAIQGLHRHINPKRSYWPAVDVKRQTTWSLPHPTNERQRSITDFWSCILDNDYAARQH